MSAWGGGGGGGVCGGHFAKCPRPVGAVVVVGWRIFREMSAWGGDGGWLGVCVGVCAAWRPLPRLWGDAKLGLRSPDRAIVVSQVSVRGGYFAKCPRGVGAVMVVGWRIFRETGYAVDSTSH